MELIFLCNLTCRTMKLIPEVMGCFSQLIYSRELGFVQPLPQRCTVYLNQYVYCGLGVCSLGCLVML